MNNIKQYTTKIILLVTLLLSICTVKATGIIIGPTTVQAGVSYQYFSFGVGNDCNTPLVWAASGGSIVSGQGTPVITVVWNCSSSGSLTAQKAGCSHISWGDDDYEEAAPFSVTIISNIPSVATIIGVDTVCENSTTTYTLNPGSNPATTYSWSLPSGGLFVDPITSATTTTITGTTVTVLWDDLTNNNGTTQSGTISVTPSTGSCSANPPGSLTVTIRDFQEVSITVSPATLPLCGGSQRTYTLLPADPKVLYYVWNLPVGANHDGTSSVTGSSIVVNFDPYAQDGDMIVTPVYPCGNGIPDTIEVDVTVLPFPPGQIQGPEAACSSTTLISTLNIS